MLKRLSHRFVQRYGIWLLVQLALGTAVVALTAVVVLHLALPVEVHSAAGTAAVQGGLVSEDELLETLQGHPTAARRIADVMRPGLFKSAAPLRDRPMADKTIEKIRSQLTLQCIMQINGEAVAYVNVQNNGLKKCRVGESVEDLFTVLNINDKSVEISIIEHRTILSL